MDIRMAGSVDVAHLALLLWLYAAPDERAGQSIESFADDLADWWSDHDRSHVAFIARAAEWEVVGMAWLAILPRVPRPGARDRRSADIQSVFVLPAYRRRRIGEALVHAATEHAFRLGAGRVTVHSGHDALSIYERLGFASSRQLLQKERQPPAGVSVSRIP